MVGHTNPSSFFKVIPWGTTSQTPSPRMKVHWPLLNEISIWFLVDFVGPTLICTTQHLGYPSERFVGIYGAMSWIFILAIFLNLIFFYIAYHNVSYPNWWNRTWPCLSSYFKDTDYIDVFLCEFWRKMNMLCKGYNF